MEFTPNFEASAIRSVQIDSLNLRFRDALEMVAVAVLIVEPNGTIAYANSETESLFGYSVTELLSIPFEFLLAERFRSPSSYSDQERRFFSLPAAIEANDGQNLVGLRKDGKEIPIEVKLRETEHQEQRLWICTVCEMFAWERSQIQLKKRTLELTDSIAENHDFSHLAAHDLQEPLRKIVSSLQALVEDHAEKLESEALRWIDFAVDGAKRMQRLVNDLHAFSCLSSHNQVMQKVDSNAALRVVLNNLSDAIEASSVCLICHPLPSIIADENQFITLLQNLVDNAIRFRTGIAPCIEIGVMPVEHCAKQEELRSPEYGIQNADIAFYVRDNAIGIASEYFEQIFDVLQRLHSRQEYEGTGMGLAFCKRIVEKHGGRLWLESTPGQGSTFYFTWGTNTSNLA